MSVLETRRAVNFGPNVRAERMGLEISEDLSFEDWVAIGSKLGVVADSSAWWIGDWVSQGEIVYGRKYELALDVTGLEKGTLMNRAYVARAFAQISRRRELLGFEHHQTVASLPEAEQDEWLDRAEANEWGLHQLRSELRDSRALSAPKVVALQRIQIDAEPERAQRWRDAAERVELPFAEWASEALDRAAA